MGTWAIKERAGLKPVYRYIFSRLSQCGIDWKYSFPRLHAIRFKKQEDSGENFKGYDAGASFAAEQKEQEEEEEFARFQDELEELYRKSVEEARAKPPPETVQAYFEKFGKWPLGWPPLATEGEPC